MASEQRLFATAKTCGIKDVDAVSRIGAKEAARGRAFLFRLSVARDVKWGRIFMRKDVVVLGAGIVGVSIAVHLQQRGRSVLLVDGAGRARKPPTAMRA